MMKKIFFILIINLIVLSSCVSYQPYVDITRLKEGDWILLRHDGIREEVMIKHVTDSSIWVYGREPGVDYVNYPWRSIDLICVNKFNADRTIDLVAAGGLAYSFRRGFLNSRLITK